MTSAIPSTPYTGPTIIAFALTTIGDVYRCWNLWSDGHLSYGDTTYHTTRDGMIYPWLYSPVRVSFAPSGLSWQHGRLTLEGGKDYRVHYESAPEVAVRILALPEEERTIAIQLAWQDVYVTTLLTTRSLMSAYAAMLTRACDLRALDPRLVLNPLPPKPATTIAYNLPSIKV